MKDAHRTISSHIDETGPFDGVLGFSQGASMALSYLLQHQIEFPEKPSPFKFALCFSSTIPLSRDPKCHAEVLDSLSDAQRRSLLPLRSDDLAGLDITQRIFVNRLARAVEAAVLCGRLGREFADDILLPGNDHLVPRILHPDLTRERLNIPTVHVLGKKDFPFMKEMTQNARNICEAELRRDVEHTGGHELPRTAKEIRAVVVELDWAARHCGKL
jgi:Serine hydrolase (FSH1)